MERRIKALGKERIDLVPYDPAWPARFTEVENELKRNIPRMLMLRIAHIGSTAVPGLSAKPIIDVQVEVGDVEGVRDEVVPRMEALGYEFIWRPSMGDAAPFYAWFIKRDDQGARTVHVHMVPPGQASVDRIVFREYLRAHPEEAARYEALKHQLHAKHPENRDRYTQGKTAIIQEMIALARREKMKR